MTSLLQTLRRSRRDILPGVDGGITRAKVAEITRLGAELIVTGSAVFDGRAPAENARAMPRAVATARRGTG